MTVVSPQYKVIKNEEITEGDFLLIHEDGKSLPHIAILHDVKPESVILLLRLYPDFSTQATGGSSRAILKLMDQWRFKLDPEIPTTEFNLLNVPTGKIAVTPQGWFFASLKGWRDPISINLEKFLTYGGTSLRDCAYFSWKIETRADESEAWSLFYKPGETTEEE